MSRSYDKAYFDKWYRHPVHRVKSPTELARQCDFVLHAAEWLLGRRVRSVLDVGCGEGQWRVALRKLRPRLRYTGVDSSEYAIARYGRQRHLLLGSIDTLDNLPLDAHYDLVVCCGMLNYLPLPQLRDGLAQVAGHTGGVAYLEIFSREDATEGDTNWPTPRSARWYRGTIARAGLLSVGMHCYVTRDGPVDPAAMEMCAHRD